MRTTRCVRLKPEVVVKNVRDFVDKILLYKHTETENTFFFYFFLFYHQQWSHTHFNLLSLQSCNFNNFVTWAKDKDKTPWKWCTCTETCSSAYDVWNIVNIYVVHLLVSIINNKIFLLIYSKQSAVVLNKTILRKCKKD